MLKELLKEEEKARVQAEAAYALTLAFIAPFGDEALPFEEWDLAERKLRNARAKLEGRYDALWHLRNIVSFNPEVQRDVNYKRMKNSWYRYYGMLEKIA